MATALARKRSQSRMLNRVSPETFVETWQKSGSPDEVAQQLGISKKTAIHKAIAYRKHSVPLKKMMRGRTSTVDWNGLRVLAKTTRS